MTLNLRRLWPVNYLLTRRTWDSNLLLFLKLALFCQLVKSWLIMIFDITTPSNQHLKQACKTLVNQILAASDQSFREQPNCKYMLPVLLTYICAIRSAWNTFTSSKPPTPATQSTSWGHHHYPHHYRDNQDQHLKSDFHSEITFAGWMPPTLATQSLGAKKV